ncbi:ethanolamine ammonia-lyase subunit EutC [bacterium]|nr:ethanolamine ammonia-lyase subunit EutC [bacterium]
MDFLKDLKQFTHARIALRRAGHSLSTQEVLSFKLAHSKAKDNVWKDLDSEALRAAFESFSYPLVDVQSRCQTKQEYLLRPDKGRELSPESFSKWEKLAQKTLPPDCLLVLADGLSASALKTHGISFTQAFFEGAKKRGFSLGPLVLARYSRVALGDVLGETLKARSVLMLIGERPGLASPESLSVYFTYAPAASKTDAERNCISNIQERGLTPKAAAEMALFLMEQSLKKQLSGVRLKVEYGGMALNSIQVK